MHKILILKAIIKMSHGILYNNVDEMYAIQIVVVVQAGM